MNTFSRITAIALLTSVPLWAQAHGDQGSWQGHGPGMMMSQDQMQQMHQNWSDMDSMMQRIPQAASPQERQQMMRDYQQTMQQQMELMHQGMMAPGAMAGPQRGMMNGQGMTAGQPMMDGPGNGGMSNGGRQRSGTAPTTEERVEMLQQRMDQMQLMMEQMLKYQQLQAQ